MLSLKGLFITDESHALLHKVFNTIDTDRNGVLTAHDFAARALNASSAQTAQRRWALLEDAFDLNGDHQVTRTLHRAPKGNCAGVAHPEGFRPRDPSLTSASSGPPPRSFLVADRR